jgi:hypothetical protein
LPQRPDISILSAANFFRLKPTYIYRSADISGRVDYRKEVVAGITIRTEVRSADQNIKTRSNRSIVDPYSGSSLQPKWNLAHLVGAERVELNSIDRGLSQTPPEKP